MTEVSKIVLSEHKVRKSKAQKEKFREYIKSEAEKAGHKVFVQESSGLAKVNNLIVGDLERAEVIYGAHYDTPATLPVPNFVTPKNLLFFILFQLLVASLVVVPYLVILLILTSFLPYSIANIISLPILFGIVWLLMAGPANKNNYNDNSSGCVALIDAMLSDNMVSARAAYVFFDLEEAGLFGSAAFASKYKHLKHIPLINLDCVGDGQNMMFRPSRKFMKTTKYAAFKEAILGEAREGIAPLICEGGLVIYPSDQLNFPVNAAVAALKKKKFIGYYLDKIHTKRDLNCSSENIAYLKDVMCRFAQTLSSGEYNSEAQVNEQAEQVEQVEQAEQVEQVEQVGQAEQAEQVEANEQAEANEQVEQVEQVEANEQVEQAEANEQVEQAEQAE